MTPAEQLEYLKLKQQRFAEILRAEFGENISVGICVFQSPALYTAAEQDPAWGIQDACASVWNNAGHIFVYGTDPNASEPEHDSLTGTEAAALELEPEFNASDVIAAVRL